MARQTLRIQDLGDVVKQRRLREGLSLRDVAKQCEVSFNTLARVERGHVPDLANFRRIVAWLGLPPERFFDPPRRRWESTPEVIAEHLRVDPNLPPEAAKKIAGIVEDLYQALARREERLALHLRAAKTFDPRAVNLLSRILIDIETRLLREDEQRAPARIQGRS